MTIAKINNNLKLKYEKYNFRNDVTVCSTFGECTR